MARKSGHYTLLKSVKKICNQQNISCWLENKIEVVLSWNKNDNTNPQGVRLGLITDFKSAYPLKNQSSSGMGRRAGGSGREALVEPPPPVYLGITLGV